MQKTQFMLQANALSLNEELIELRKHVREQDKEIRRLKEENEFLEEASQKQRLMFLAMKTEGGTMKGNISFYCKSLGVTKQGFHNYLKYKDRPWKYQSLADAMLDICAEEEWNPPA